MSEFLFEKSQRVTVPPNVAGAENVQAVVTGNRAELGREPEYRLQWPSPFTVNEDGTMKMIFASVSESELLKAQPPAMVSAAETSKRASDAYESGRHDAESVHEMARQSRAELRARKRKASTRKRTRK